MIETVMNVSVVVMLTTVVIVVACVAIGLAIGETETFQEIDRRIAGRLKRRRRNDRTD